MSRDSGRARAPENFPLKKYLGTQIIYRAKASVVVCQGVLAFWNMKAGSHSEKKGCADQQKRREDVPAMLGRSEGRLWSRCLIRSAWALFSFFFLLFFFFFSCIFFLFFSSLYILLFPCLLLLHSLLFYFSSFCSFSLLRFLFFLHHHLLTAAAQERKSVLFFFFPRSSADTTLQFCANIWPPLHPSVWLIAILLDFAYHTVFQFHNIILSWIRCDCDL